SCEESVGPALRGAAARVAQPAAARTATASALPRARENRCVWEDPTRRNPCDRIATRCPDRYGSSPPDARRTTTTPTAQPAPRPPPAVPLPSARQTPPPPPPLAPAPAAATSPPAPAIAPAGRRSAAARNTPSTSPGRCCRHAPGSSHCSSAG